MKRKEFHYSNNNYNEDRGSTLITVIVAIAFVTILVSIILGTTVVNVRMKGIDRRTKDDFYYVEKALNDIYTGLGQELAKKAGDEYEEVFKKVGTKETNEEDDTIDFNLAEEAENEYRKSFMEQAYLLVDNLDGAKNKKVTKEKLKEYVVGDTDPPHITIDKDVSIVYQEKNGEETKSLSKAYRTVLKDVEISYTDSSGFRSTISTDIIINIPTVDFLGTNADVSDYGLIANQGLYIDAEHGEVTIDGNVYAGTHDTSYSLDDFFAEITDEFSHTPVFGGINIRNGKVTFDGNYIISKGDINLAGNNPHIKVNSPEGGKANLANLWFTSLRTISGAKITPVTTPVPSPHPNPTIDINANVFALNDMVLNADNSSAVIQGNYYGYNEGGLSNILGKKDKRDDSANSAIIINGSKAYLDMRSINNFVLMGKAYIDFTSDSQTVVESMGSLTQVVPTAEGVALKTNQQLYLVPPDFLKGPNPVQSDSGEFNLSITESDLKAWFGYSFLKNPFDVKYEVKTDEGSVYYDYLDFYEKGDHVNWRPKDVTDDVSVLPADTDSVKYIATKEIDDEGIETFKVIKYSKDSADVGRGGSISSQAMFFLKIMTARSTYEYMFENGGKTEGGGYSDVDDYIQAKENGSGLIQPSAYRLYERLNRSMTNEDFFDLSQCVVGNSSSPEDAHYYAKNAVVNYERNGDDKIQSNVLNNTDGMFRYAEYTQNLYKRYIFLCTALDGKEDKLLEAPDIGTPNMSEWTVKSDAPVSRYIVLDNLDTMAIQNSLSGANSEGLKPGAFGVVVAQKGDLDMDTLRSIPGVITPSGTFYGVAIVDGNITVPYGMNVNGLLISTKTIVLGGDNDINYDKGLIQSRIEKEINIVKNKDVDTGDKYKGKQGYKNYYLISYLSKDGLNLIYDVSPGSKIKRERIEADFNDFMHYENWQKGEK